MSVSYRIVPHAQFSKGKFKNSMWNRTNGQVFIPVSHNLIYNTLQLHDTYLFVFHTYAKTDQLYKMIIKWWSLVLWSFSPPSSSSSSSCCCICTRRAVRVRIPCSRLVIHSRWILGNFIILFIYLSYSLQTIVLPIGDCCSCSVR